MTNPLLEVPRAFHDGNPIGIASVCSAHPLVIEAALRLAKETGRVALIEATCNQVNQEGGYTGMTPRAFRSFLEGIAAKAGLDMNRVILGGDHLGPNPWKHLSAAEAMEKAGEMISAYAEAGFTKLHLDTSMGCADEPVALNDELTAERAARLAVLAEASKGSVDPVYVIGTEVPVPGGSLEALGEIDITSPEAALGTYEAHRSAFFAAGAEDAFGRVFALVVQPGVEFGHADIIHFKSEKAKSLTATLSALPGIVFEAHSTDYQTEQELAKLVAGGFAILKVGPWLTFALREALYGLDAIADVMEGHAPQGRLMTVMDEAMRARPEHWKKYYTGDDNSLWLQRHFSYSDRIRYYWPSSQADAAVAQLRDRIVGRRIPKPVLDQYLPGAPSSNDFEELVMGAVQRVLLNYERACATLATTP